MGVPRSLEAVLLSLEAALVARLETLSGLRGVHGLAALSDEKTRPTPCAYVAYDGASVVENKSDGTAARLAVRWLVVLAARNVRQASGQAAREDMQPLLAATLGRLLGWLPAGASRALRLIELPAPQFANGTMLMPLVFDTIQLVKTEE